jgi:UDPglucose--hexose-1-phosphate uridylyltransferase
MTPPNPPTNPVEPAVKVPGHAASTDFTSGAAEIRRHYYLNRYVVIAPKRHLRPGSFGGDRQAHRTETADSPALELEPAIYQVTDEQGNWQVKVIANAFPALSLDNPKAYGHQEIIIDTPEHNREFSDLPLNHIERIFDAYINRHHALSALPGIEYVSIFKNDGPKAGASIAHAHSQAVAWPLVPPDVQAEADVINSYTANNGTCPHCDVIAWELDQKQRVIFQDDYFVAVSPYATRVPFGTWLLPRRHCSHISQLSQKELHSMAKMLKNLTTTLDQAEISFNFFLQNALPGHDHHFVLRLEPRISIWAGGEFSTGIVFNVVPPEYAALWYQGKV